MVIGELVLEVLLASLMSVAVTVSDPAVFEITLNVWLPPTRAALAGKLAFASEVVIPTVSLALVSKFQFASTAFTVTLNTTPAVCVAGVPVLPVALPGEELSPGASTWSRVKAPGFTVIAGLLFAEIAP